MGLTSLSRNAEAGLALLVTVLLMSCRTVIQPTSGGAVIEPRADLEPGLACNLQFGAAKVNAVFSAINRQDIAATQELFAAQGEFVIEPMFELVPSIRQSLLAGHLVAASQEDTATNRTEVPPLVASLVGLHFVFTSPLQGNAGLVEHVSPEQTIKVREVDLGPVLWKATGPALGQHGKTAISGTGKIAVSCESGHIFRMGVGARKLE